MLPRVAQGLLFGYSMPMQNLPIWKKWRNAKFLRVLGNTVKACLADDVPTLGAALSYYSVFALAPLLIILIAAAGFVFGQQASQGEVFASLRGTVGAQAAQAIQTLLQSVNHKTTGLIATVVGIVTLLVGALGLFAQLQSSLNFIWHVPAESGSGWKSTVRRRALAFALLAGVAVLMLMSLALSAVLGALGRFVTQTLPGGEALWHGVHFFVSLVLLSVLFAMVFKILPDARIRWRDVWSGAVFTSLFFTLGKMALGIYLGKSGISSAYGAASSLLLLLAWIYYSSQIFFVGAEFTRAYASINTPERELDAQTPPGGSESSGPSNPSAHPNLKMPPVATPKAS